MTADLLNAEITDAATLDLLPLGAVVMNDIATYQRIIDGDWYCAGSDEGVSAEELIRRGPVTVLWLPPEVTR